MVNMLQADGEGARHVRLGPHADGRVELEDGLQLLGARASPPAGTPDRLPAAGVAGQPVVGSGVPTAVRPARPHRRQLMTPPPTTTRHNGRPPLVERRDVEPGALFLSHRRKYQLLRFYAKASTRPNDITYKTLNNKPRNRIHTRLQRKHPLISQRITKVMEMFNIAPGFRSLFRHLRSDHGGGAWAKTPPPNSKLGKLEGRRYGDRQLLVTPARSHLSFFRSRQY